MSRHSIFEASEPVNVLNHQTMEFTFRLLRNHNPLLAFLIKNALTELKIRDQEQNAHSINDVVYIPDLIELLGTLNIIQVVGNLNEIARDVLIKKDMPPSHFRILRDLIEVWAGVAEWILENAAFDQVAYH